MFKITAEATKQIKTVAKQDDVEELVLRFAARENQDGSFAYNMGFDKLTEEDVSMTCQDIRVAIDRAYLHLLEETTLDYVQLDDGEYQFVFLNPLDPTYVPPTA